MINRRELLKSVAGLVAFATGETLLAKHSETTVNPLGKAIGFTFECDEETPEKSVFFETNRAPFRYAVFPVQTKLTVEYEYGFRQWIAYNTTEIFRKQFRLGQFTMFDEQEGAMHMKGIIYRNVNFRAHYTSMKPNIPIRAQNRILQEILRDIPQDGLPSEKTSHPLLW